MHNTVIHNTVCLRNPTCLTYQTNGWWWHWGIPKSRISFKVGNEATNLEVRNLTDIFWPSFPTDLHTYIAHGYTIAFLPPSIRGFPCFFWTWAKKFKFLPRIHLDRQCFPELVVATVWMLSSSKGGTTETSWHSLLTCILMLLTSHQKSIFWHKIKAPSTMEQCQSQTQLICLEEPTRSQEASI